MRVKMLIGAYSGQVLDIVAHAAQNLLTTGQAVLPDAERVEEPAIQDGIEPPAVVAGKKKK